MALITLPAKFGLSQVKLTLQRGGVTLRSRFTGKRQTVVYPFAMWTLEASIIDYPESDEARAIRAFLVNLDGQKNTFQMPVPGYTQPNTAGFLAYLNSVGDIIGIIGGVAAGATQLNITIGYTGTTIKTGEYFNIGDELKMATSDAVADGGGNAIIKFKPPTRKARGAGFLLKFKNPYSLMHAEDDDVASWGLQPPIRHGFKISAIEAIE